MQTFLSFSSIVVGLLYFTTIDAFAVTLASRGTLVAVVASRDGLIIAADSRRNLAGNTVHCDDAVKIIEPKKAARIAATVVGNAQFFEPPGPNDVDLCRYIKRAQRPLDVFELVSHYLETETPDVSTSRMEELALQSVAAVEKFNASSAETLKPFAGGDLFQVVLMGYDPKTRRAVIRDFVVRLSPDPIKPEAGKIISRKFSFESKRGILLFGQRVYFDTNVARGIGRQFLSQETIRFIRQETSVGKTDFREAVAAVINVIDAASKTTALVAPRGGIGGPIDVLLLGNESRPRRLQWKSQ